jgi:hypothetical protein
VAVVWRLARARDKPKFYRDSCERVSLPRYFVVASADDHSRVRILDSVEMIKPRCLYPLLPFLCGRAWRVFGLVEWACGAASAAAAAALLVRQNSIGCSCVEIHPLVDWLLLRVATGKLSRPWLDVLSRSILLDLDSYASCCCCGPLSIPILA